MGDTQNFTFIGLMMLVGGILFYYLFFVNVDYCVVTWCRPNGA